MADRQVCEASSWLMIAVRRPTQLNVHGTNPGQEALKHVRKQTKQARRASQKAGIFYSLCFSSCLLGPVPTPCIMVYDQDIYAETNPFSPIWFGHGNLLLQ